MLTLRDLFQVVFEMKKQEVEAAKARKSQKEEDKATDKAADTSSPEKPAAQEAAYDVSNTLVFIHSLILAHNLHWTISWLK